jgi:hypothetical protein
VSTVNGDWAAWDTFPAASVAVTVHVYVPSARVATGHDHASVVDAVVVQNAVVPLLAVNVTFTVDSASAVPFTTGGVAGTATVFTGAVITGLSGGVTSRNVNDTGDEFAAPLPPACGVNVTVIPSIATVAW